MGFYDVNHKHNVDHLYKSACYSEANWLKGNECKFYPCINYDRDLESDYHAKLGDPVIVNVVLEDYTKAELEKLNWIAESDELPFHAYISNIIWPEFIKARKEFMSEGGSFKDYFNSCFNENGELVTDQPWYVRVSKFAILEFPYVMEVAGTQKFRVLKVLGDQTNPFIWDCQIAPHREHVDYIPETPWIDDVTNYRKDAKTVGKAYTKQTNYNEKSEEKYPPDKFMPEEELPEPPEIEGPEPPDGDEPSKPKPPDEFQPLEPEPPEGIEPPEEIKPEPPEPVEPEGPDEWEEPTDPVPEDKEEDSGEEGSEDHGDEDEGKPTHPQIETMNLDPTNPYLKMYGK